MYEEMNGDGTKLRVRDGGSLQPRTPAPDGCKKQIQCHADHHLRS